MTSCVLSFWSEDKDYCPAIFSDLSKILPKSETLDLQAKLHLLNVGFTSFKDLIVNAQSHFEKLSRMIINTLTNDENDQIALEDYLKGPDELSTQEIENSLYYTVEKYGSRCILSIWF
jgi:hypothetical protein